MSARPGFVVWFTGLSGSGKSTLATLLSAELVRRGVHVEILDGDEVRRHLSKGLGFSREDRDTNVRRIGFVAKLLARAGACAMTAAISPYRDVREELRRDIGRFLEVYCRCPVDVLAARDPKGLYEKALAGEIAHFSGVTDPYEEPLSPDVIVDTSVETKEASVRKIIQAIEARGLLDEAHLPSLPAPHGGALLTPALVASPGAGPCLKVDRTAVAWWELAALGALSPVAGPLGEKDAVRVRKERRLESGRAWPIAWLLPCDADLAEGQVVPVEGTPFALVVHETFRLGGVRHVSGSVGLTEPSFFSDAEARSPRRVRERLAELGGGALGRVVRTATDLEGLRALRAAASTRPLVVLAAGVRVSAEANVIVVDLPQIPAIGEAESTLLEVLLLKNYGVGTAVVHSMTGVSSAFTEAELGVELWVR